MEMNGSVCIRCPRNCQVDRAAGQSGRCGVSGTEIYIARVSLHMWEEPCISGNTGSGTVFFFGCPLRCIYCQNYKIAHVDPVRLQALQMADRYGDAQIHAEPSVTQISNRHSGSETFLRQTSSIISTPTKVDIRGLAHIFLHLQEQGAKNINLVTPTHYTPEIRESLFLAKKQGLMIPIVYNCSGYEKVETLKLMEGLVDIYLTDFKYMDAELAKRFSGAEDYPEVAKAALHEMVNQIQNKSGGQAQSNKEQNYHIQRNNHHLAVFDEEGIMQQGIIVRHLLLPNHVKNAKAVVKYLYETYGDQIYISLMNQYTPLPQVADIPDLNRRVTRREYESLINYAVSLGVEQGFVQEGETAMESFIPPF